jgi:WD40 repeat protein
MVIEKKHIILIISLLILLKVGLLAQSNCYNRYIAQAIDYQKKMKLKDAILNYQAARACADFPGDRMDPEDEQYFYEFIQKGETEANSYNFIAAVNYLDAALIYADDLGRTEVGVHRSLTYRKLDAFKNELVSQRESLERLNEDLTNQRDQSRSLALASRLAVLSRLERETQDFKTALQLSILARNIKQTLKGEDLPNLSYIDRTFGDAAYSYFRWVRVAPQAVKGVGFIANSNDTVFLHATNPSAFLLKVDSSNSLVLLDGHDAPIELFAASPDGKTYLTAATDKAGARIKIHQSISDSVMRGSYLSTTSARNNGIRFSPDGNHFLVFAQFPLVRLYSTASKKAIELNGHNSNVNVLDGQFSSDGQYIATRSADGVIKTWRMPDGDSIGHLQGHQERVYGFQFSPNNDRIISWSADHTAKIWGLNGELLQSLKGHTAPVLSAIFSKDGKKILTASVDKTAILWNNNGKLLSRLQGHNHRVTGALFSPNDSLMVSYDLNGKLKIWDASGQLLHELNQHTQFLTAVQFSPDGQTLLTASGDNTAKLWNLKGELLMNMDGFTARLNSAAFSKDGQYIVLGSEDKRIVHTPTPATALELIKELQPMDEATKVQFNIKE